MCNITGLADLINAVKQIGGCLVRQGDTIVVDTPNGNVPPYVTDALLDYKDALLRLFPTVNSGTTDVSSTILDVNGDQVISEETFLAELEKTRPQMPDGRQL